MSFKCKVCAGNFRLQQAAVTPCGHGFHANCLANSLLSVSKSCPACRKKITVNRIVRRVFVDEDKSAESMMMEEEKRKNMTKVLELQKIVDDQRVRRQQFLTQVDDVRRSCAVLRAKLKGKIPSLDSRVKLEEENLALEQQYNKLQQALITMEKLDFVCRSEDGFDIESVLTSDNPNFLYGALENLVAECNTYKQKNRVLNMRLPPVSGENRGYSLNRSSLDEITPSLTSSCSTVEAEDEALPSCSATPFCPGAASTPFLSKTSIKLSEQCCVPEASSSTSSVVFEGVDVNVKSNLRNAVLSAAFSNSRKRRRN